MNTKNIVIVCVTAILIGILFWPTLWKYDKFKSGDKNLPVRINRLTGFTEILYANEWVPEKRELDKNSKILPPEEMKKVTGTARILLGLNADIYNGSNWVITNMTIQVVAKERSGKVKWDRKFNSSLSRAIKPSSAESIHISIGDRDIGFFDWDIVEIRGYPNK